MAIIQAMCSLLTPRFATTVSNMGDDDICTLAHHWRGDSRLSAFVSKILVNVMIIFALWLIIGVETAGLRAEDIPADVWIFVLVAVILGRSLGFAYVERLVAERRCGRKLYFA